MNINISCHDFLPFTGTGGFIIKHVFCCSMFKIPPNKLNLLYRQRFTFRKDLLNASGRFLWNIYSFRISSMFTEAL